MQAPTDLDALGYIRTHFDCPWCGTTFDVEGDATGDEIQCPDCETKFRCREVR